MVLNIVKDILNLVPVAAIDNEEREEFVNGSKYNTLAINRKNPIHFYNVNVNCGI